MDHALGSIPQDAKFIIAAKQLISQNKIDFLCGKLALWTTCVDDAETSSFTSIIAVSA
jgi:hypothetical protein